MDLSDGLSQDLRRMAVASGLVAEIGMPPAFRGASREQTLHGGEDYELLFTVRKGTRVPKEFGGIRLTGIGTMRKGTAGTVLLAGAPLPALGYDHLR
jgi:thiamine-monophosphate kinase